MYRLITLDHPNLIEECVRYLRDGKILCAPTDTIYGLLVDATNREAVENLYRIRRPSNRPFIVLLPNEDWLYTFKPLIKPKHLKILSFGVTLVLYPKLSFPMYLTRGKRSLAFRIPSKQTFIGKLLSVLNKPLVAPSANPEGLAPAKNIEEAIVYFGEKVDLYVDGGTFESKPSTVFKLIGYRSLKVLRVGNVDPQLILKEFRNLKIKPARGGKVRFKE